MIILTLTAGAIHAQDLSNVKEEQPVKISGSFNSTGIGYHAYGIENRRDPFNWYMTAGLSISLYGWSIPFSFTYSNQDHSFSQPFNRYGVAPEYKWVKTYIGYNSMNFSRYTLAGHVFLGGGVELTPGKFKVSAMYGRLNEEIVRDSLNLSVYKRMGYGLKIGYADKGDAVDVILFHARDELNSEIITSDELKPQENLVMSITGRKKITERIFVAAEYATSALTRDIRADGEAGENGIFKLSTPLFQSSATTEYYNAFNSSINYGGKSFSINAAFERVDPGYTTLGAYYFNNDLQNITLGGTVKLLEQKVNIAVNGGVQKNNLDDTEVSDMERVVGNINISYVPDQQWNINTSYSNFTTFTNIRPRFDPFFQNELDTLNFYQINQNASAIIGYSFGSKENRKSIFFSGTCQIMEEEQSDLEGTRNSNFINSNIAYRFGITPLDLSVSVAANFNRNSMAEMNSTAYGPVATLSKTFFEKKLRAGLTGTFNQVLTDEKLSSKIMNLRLNGSYRLKKKHKVSFFFNMLRRFATEQSSQQFNEFTGQVSYGYSF